MENEPSISITLPIHSIQLYQLEDNRWEIRDTETNTTTVGETKYEALVSLADALAGYDDANIDLAAKSDEIFTKNKELSGENTSSMT